MGEGKKRGLIGDWLGGLSRDAMRSEVPDRPSERETTLVHVKDWDAGLDRVLSRPDGIRVVVQPIVALSGGGIVGYEVLTRITDRLRASPVQWFSEAQSRGRGAEIERRVLDLGLEVRGQLGASDAFLALNVSTPMFCSDHFRQWMASAGDLAGLVFEMTEHAAIVDELGFTTSLDELRHRGGRVAIDDAGAGYSGLRRILEVRPQLLKIDRALVSGLDEDPSKRALVRMLTQFAADTGARALAEGVETDAEHACLLEIGVPLAQGYYFAKPGPPFPDVIAVEGEPPRG